MDKVIVTALLIIGSVSAAVVAMVTIGPAISGSAQSVVEANEEASVRLKTSIELIAAAPNPAGTQIDAWVKNVGVATIAALDKSDVFVITPGTRYDAMTHAASGDNTWIEDPLPSSWNRGDTLHLTITLPAGNPPGAGDHVLSFSTPNGVTAERIFSK